MLVSVVGNAKRASAVFLTAGERRLDQKRGADFKIERHAIEVLIEGNVDTGGEFDAVLASARAGSVGGDLPLEIHHSIQLLQAGIDVLIGTVLHSNIGIKVEVGDVTIPGNEGNESAHVLLQGHVDIQA